jgi:L-ascorbate metabolism protein UlaG (beta-lactamase superfamily)
MRITKLGHCCLLIEEAGLRILTDPGSYTIEAAGKLRDIDVVLITHEHADHFHLESLKNILIENPEAEVITNRGVGNFLRKEAIFFTCLEHEEEYAKGSVLLQGYGKDHAPIYPGVPEVINTGYFINNKLFYPGDAFYNPEREIPILALPVAGPWVKISEAIDYAKLLKPKLCFPVHDGMITPPGGFDRWPGTFLPSAGISFHPLALGEAADLS